MAKTKAVKVNLSTKAADVLATIKEEEPKAWYFFRKQYGGKRKFAVAVAQMMDKAMEEKCDQFTDLDYYISPVGNRWMTYVQVKYYPKAHYVMAHHYAFIYYETYASCGAFFPMYSPKGKGGTVKPGSTPTSVIRFTDHFFYQLSERTGIDYRSKELIRKFVSERCEHAMSADEDGEVVLKFNGGHGFGKEIAKHPQFIDCRTYLGDEQLNGRQKLMCEPVDQMHELIKDGMFIKDVALHTAIHEDHEDPETIAANMKQLEAVKKLGLEKPMMLIYCVSMTFVRMLEDLLHVDVDTKQSAVVASMVTDNCVKLINKWGEAVEAELDLKNKDFRSDVLDVLTKTARQMGLKYLTRERMDAQIQCILDSSVNKKSSHEK